MAYTAIDDPSVYFQTALYTGSGSSTQNVVNGGNSDLQPDLVWVKHRGATRWHRLVDSSRGVSKNLYSNEDDGEGTEASVTAFNSDGFSLGTDTGSDGWNEDGDAHVAWQWKANGGTTASNSSGTNITSTVQANTTAGFSIVTFTGTGNDGDSYGHGLSSAPELVFPKKRGGTSNWQGYFFSSDGEDSQYFYLNLNNSFANTTGNSAASSSSVITTDGSGDSNPSGGTVVSYCFHSVKGYSKIGRYTGNNSTDGPFIYTGFKPAWVMAKRTDASGNNWPIWDNKRGGYNGARAELYANLNNAEATDSAIDILSNGFKLRNASTEWNNGSYIYMAFAEHPFVSSKGVPVTAG